MRITEPQHTLSGCLRTLAKLVHHGVEPDAMETDLRNAAVAAERLEARWGEDEHVIVLRFDLTSLERASFDSHALRLPAFLEADWHGEDLKVGDWFLEDDGKLALKISVPVLRSNGREPA